MHKIRLNNGITVITQKKRTDSVTIQVIVKTGSNDEKDGIRGISHFIEHMLFEGTKKRTYLQIANEIESLGGELNAATSNEITFYYIKILKKHFSKALDVLSDLVQNPLFSKRSIEKERKVILSEAKMTYDDPRFYQWVLFSKALYKKYPAKYPIIGSIDNIKKIDRKDIVSHYNAHYHPNNIIITIVGGLSRDVIKCVKNRFRIKPRDAIQVKYHVEPEQAKPVNIYEKRKIQQSYLVLGYKTVCRKHKDSYTLDVIRAILGKGLSGRMFNEIRSKRGLGYEVGIHHEANPNYGFFSVYVTIDKKNINLVKSIILKELRKLNNVTKAELKEAMDYIEGEFLLRNEDTKDYAHSLSLWEVSSKAEDFEKYIKNIKKTTLSDIVRISEKYFHNNYTMAVIQQS